MAAIGQPAGDGAPLPATNGTGPHHQQKQHTNGIAAAQAASATPPPQLRRFPDVCYKLRRAIFAFLDGEIPASQALLRNVQSQVRVSIDVIDKALRRYSLDQISLSYNGGKDCLVLLILILACLPACDEARAPDATPEATPEATPDAADTPDAQTRPPADGTLQAAVAATPAAAAAAPPPPPSSAHRPFQAIYIVPPDPFPEVDEFVDQSTADYHLDLARYPMAMRAALDAYLADRPAVRAIFMGTRRTDPHGEFLTHFTPTDPGWPQFMRIHPVIDWHYAEIWAFIRHFDIPFCSLYNRGFTSLGGTTDTRPNPVLVKAKPHTSTKNVSDDGDTSGASTPTSFRPAYELIADEEERLGRGK